MISNFGRSLLLASAMVCLFFVPTSTTLAFQNPPTDVHLHNSGVQVLTVTTATPRDQLRQQWLDNSMSYYSKIMREERRRNMGQISHEKEVSPEYQQDFQRLAQKHWFAIRKVKEGQYQQAEILYRKIIAEIMAEDDDDDGCDHAKLAVTTLLLALHCQRMGDLKKTRSVFLNFFRVVVVTAAANSDDDEGHSECACSAKVLGAFALFEMKQGNAKKSLEIARKAVEFDPALEPVLNWKQFRDVETRQQQRRGVSRTSSNLHP